MTYNLELLRADVEDELDWDRERAVALKLRPAAALLRKQVVAFLERLPDIRA